MKVRQYIGQPQGNLPVVPSTGAYQSALGEAVAGMNQITKGLAEIAQVGQNIYKRHQDQKRKNDLQSAQLVVEKDWLEFKIGYDRSNPDPINYSKGLIEGWDKIVSTQAKGLKDSITRNAFQDKMDTRKLMEVSKSYAEQERRFQNQYFAQSQANVDECVLMAIETDDPERGAMFQQMAEEELNKGYPFTPEYAQKNIEINRKIIEEGRQKNAKARLYMDTMRDPGGTLRKLMLPPDSGYYPEIKDAEREKGIADSERIFKAKQMEQRQEQDRIEKEEHDIEEVDLWRKFATGTLTLSDIGNTKRLSGDERYIWQRRMEEKIKNRENIKTDFRVYAQLQEAIITLPKRQVVAMIADASDKNLSEGDAEKLLGKLDAHTKGLRDHWTKKGYDFLKSKFVTKRDKLGQLLQTPEEMERYLMGTNILDMEIQSSIQRGKPLDGMDIYNKSVEIWQGIKLSPAEQMEEKLGAVREIRKEREARKELEEKGKQPSPPPITSKKIPPSRNENESFEDYLKRITGKK